MARLSAESRFFSITREAPAMAKADRFATQRGNGRDLFALDGAAGAVDHLFLLLLGLRQQVTAHLLGHGAAVGDDLLRLGAGGLELRTLLRQQLLGLGPIALGAVDGVLQGLLARFDRGKQRLEGIP